MKIKFLGTRGYIEEKNNKHKMHSSILILGKTKLLIDFGETWLGSFDKIKPKPDYLLITHAHPDHINGIDKSIKIPIIIPPPVVKVFKKKTGLSKFKVIKDSKKIGEFKVKRVRCVHSLKAPMSGYIIESPRGIKIGYFPDILDMRDKSVLKGLDLYIGDGASPFRNLVRRKGNKRFGHASIQTQLEWLKKYGVKYAVFTHFGKWAILKNEDAILKKLRKMYPGINIYFMKDGQTVEIRKKGFQTLEVLKKKMGEEGETRAEKAMEFWMKNWWKSYPKSGKGQFVYQHHWRGLTEEETKMSEEELLNTNHSIHGDLRFEVDKDKLWGFTVFTGEAKEVKDAGGCLLCKTNSKRKLQGTFKLYQPHGWLNVGKKKPYISKPGEIGSTTKKYAKFFAIDWGNYEMGVWREHFFEVFLHGKKLKGRFLIQYAPIGGKRIWLIHRPEDQTPYAEKHKLEDVIKELKKKGQKYLIWAKPGMKPKLIDVTKVELKKLKFVLVSRLLGKKKFLELRLEKTDDVEVWRFEPLKAGEKIKLKLPAYCMKKSPLPKEKLEFEGIISKGKPGASRDYPAILRIIEKGTYELIRDERGLKELKFNGKKLKGTFIIERLEPEKVYETKYLYKFYKKSETLMLLEEILAELSLILKEKSEETVFRKNEGEIRLEAQLGKSIVPLKIRGIALAEGTWNGLFYPAEEIKKAAKKLEGVRLMLDHSSSVKDIAGKVTKAEYDPEVKGIRFEAEVIREDIAKLILEGLIQGVSVGVVVDRHIEGGRLVARNYDFNELSLVITPACEKCVITDVKTS